MSDDDFLANGIPRSGWVFGPWGERGDSRRPEIPIQMWVKSRVPAGSRFLPGTYDGPFSYDGPFYGPWGDKEHRVSRLQIHLIIPERWTPDTVFTFRATRTTAAVPVTPFDPFLIGIENGDSGAAAALIDHLTELQGEERLPTAVNWLPDGRPVHTSDILLRLKEHYEAENWQEVTKLVINSFGGSRHFLASTVARS